MSGDHARRFPEGPALEEHLGDACGGGPFSWAASVARDEAEAFPVEPLRELHALGMADLFVPRALGGVLDSLEQPLDFGRALSRRDPALALSAAMAIWPQLVWMAGTERQRTRAR